MPFNHLLALGENLTIYNALGQKQQFLDALALDGDLELDLTQVAEIDTAGLQLLLLLKREGQAVDKRVRIVGHSPAVRDVIDFCGLAGYFGDPMVIAAGEATWTN